MTSIIIILIAVVYVCMLIVDVLAHCMFHCIRFEVYMTRVTHVSVSGTDYHDHNTWQRVSVIMTGKLGA